MSFSYICPKCGSLSLGVTVLSSARLYQTGDGGFQTEVEGDHEWDDTHLMRCNNCMYYGAVSEFYNGDES